MGSISTQAELSLLFRGMGMELGISPKFLEIGALSQQCVVPFLVKGWASFVSDVSKKSNPEFVPLMLTSGNTNLN